MLLLTPTPSPHSTPAPAPLGVPPLLQLPSASASAPASSSSGSSSSGSVSVSGARALRTRSLSPRPPGAGTPAEPVYSVVGMANGVPHPEVAVPPTPAAAAAVTAVASSIAPARIFPHDSLASKLPTEVWKMIFALLHSTETPLIPVALVCKRFDEITSDLRFRHLSLRSPPLPETSPLRQTWGSSPAPPARERDRSAEMVDSLLRHRPSLLPKVRSVRYVSRPQCPPEDRIPPSGTLDFLSQLTHLERLELDRIQLTAELIHTLHPLPHLRTLILRGCTPPKMAVSESLLPRYALTLEEFSIDNVLEQGPFEYFLPLLCGAQTRSVIFQGKQIPSWYLRRPSPGRGPARGLLLPPNVLRRFELPMEGLDIWLLVQFLAHQNGIRELVCAGKALPRLELKREVLPELEGLDVPVGAEAVGLLAKGRPIRRARVRALARSRGEGAKREGEGAEDGDEQDGLVGTLRALKEASATPLERLEMDVGQRVSARLVERVASTFPELRVLVIRSGEALSEDLLGDSLPSALRRLPHLRRLETARLPSSSSSTPPSPCPSSPPPPPPPAQPIPTLLSTTAQRQQRHVKAYELACPSLTHIMLQGIEWVRVGRGEWKAYPSFPPPLAAAGTQKGSGDVSGSGSGRVGSGAWWDIPLDLHSAEDEGEAEGV